MGFFCNFLATVLPFWFAKYPSAPSRFKCLGLWEICLEEFISPLNQQHLYTGCFYIFDTKIRALWPLIFAGWFHAAQALQILSMIIYVALMGCGLSILFGANDKRRPKNVMISVVLMAFICWVLITQLGVVGINIDLEKKQTEIRGIDTWLAETRFSGLSYSYGLAAFALFFVLVSLNILVWCVYPRKEPGGRLLEQAWNWPAGDDLPCCLGKSNSDRRMAFQESLRSNSRESHLQQCQFYLPSSPHPVELITYQHDVFGSSGRTDTSSLGVLMYDPRSADTLSNDTIIAAESKDDLIESLRETKLTEGMFSSQVRDPRTAVDLNLCRVSKRMSSVRSSTNESSSGFNRAQNRTYVIKKGRYQPPSQTVIPKPLVP